jgi:hypothetical protein
MECDADNMNDEETRKMLSAEFCVTNGAESGNNFISTSPERTRIHLTRSVESNLSEVYQGHGIKFDKDVWDCEYHRRTVCQTAAPRRSD